MYSETQLSQLVKINTRQAYTMQHLLPDIFCVKVRLHFVTRHNGHKSQISCSPFLRSSLFLQPFRLRFSAIVSFCLVYSWLNYSSLVVICN